MRASGIFDGPLEGVADGIGVEPGHGRAIKLGVEGKQMRNDTISTLFSSIIHRRSENNVLDDRTHSIVNAEARFVPCVDGE